MQILIIDTSGNAARWAGVEDAVMVDPVEVETGRKHDSVLAEGIVSWLKRNDWQKPDAIGIVTGPGGYTGLRVGVAFATAAAAGWGIPVVPVTAYEAVAGRAGENETVWTLLPSRKNHCRCRLMTGGSTPQAITEPDEISVLSPTWPESSKPYILLGDGYERHHETLNALASEQPTILKTDESSLLSKGEAVARVVWQAWLDKKAVSPSEIDVEYGGDFQPTAKAK